MTQQISLLKPLAHAALGQGSSTFSLQTKSFVWITKTTRANTVLCTVKPFPKGAPSTLSWYKSTLRSIHAPPHQQLESPAPPSGSRC